MTSRKNPEADLSFYTTLRYDESAEAIITRFTGSLRALLKRLGDDLREGATGEFSGGAQQLRAPLATAVDRTTGHVDVLESLLMNAPASGNIGANVRNTIANVIADANFAEVAEKHVAIPKAREGKFDQDRGGGILGQLDAISEKVKSIGELAPGLFGVVVKLIAILLKDIGMIGKATAKPARNEVGEQIEKKLEFIIPGVESLKAGQQEIKDGQKDIIDGQAQISGVVGISKIIIEDINREAMRLEQKADTLGELLGKTLVGSKWVVDPQVTTVNNVTPAKGVKEELHDIEDLLNSILNLLGPVITDGPIIPPPPPPPPPIIKVVDRLRIERIPVLSDFRLKKIFVYAENIFTPRSQTDRRIIRVQTRAFDLSGWIDLGELRSGDEVEVQVRVTFAGHRNLLFARTRFNSPGLKCFADFARGQNYLSGSNIDIVLRQRASMDGFNKPIEIAYQFVVESQ